MVAIRNGIIPVSNANRPGSKLAPNVPPYLTVHETANTTNGANAEMHRVFLVNGGGPDSVSFHFVVDDHEAVQLLPLDEIGWHAGDGCDDYPDGVGTDDIGCFASVAIETCVNADGDWPKTVKNLQELMAQIIQGDKRIDFGDGRAKGLFSHTRIAQHNAWSGKDCPHKIRSTGIWGTVVSGVANLLDVEQLPFAKPVPFPRYDGRDKTLNKHFFHAISRSVKTAVPTLPRAWADLKAPSAAPAIQKDKQVEVLYITKSGSEWWYVAKDGFRLLMDHCSQKFRPVDSKGKELKK